jgi:hypothetical protein
VAAKKRASSNVTLVIGLLACGGLIAVAVMASSWLQKPPPPVEPPATTKAPVAPTLATGNLKYTEGFYRAQIEDDFKKLDVKPVPILEMTLPLPYADELSEAKHVKLDKDVVETPHLKLATHVQKEWAVSGGQGFKYEHEVLEITNRSHKFIAYRVTTAVDQPAKCKTKGAMPHNSVALRPGETVRRTECLWRKDLDLTIKRVEVVELPNELSYVYVSRLLPTQILLDERTAAGHAIPKGNGCALVPWREIAATGTEKSSWADVIDFYARHNCDEYTFWKGYHRWTAPGSLPSYAKASP